MYLVQLLLPLYDNAGRRVSHQHFAQVRDELTEVFGGVTAYMRSPAQGTWKPEDGVIDRDEVIMCEVMVEHLDRAWWTRYRAQLEDRFGQQELMLRATAVERL